MSDKGIDHELAWTGVTSVEKYNSKYKDDKYSFATKIMKQNENEIKGVILNESQ